VDEDGNEQSGEVCDASQPGCVDDCTACEDGWIPELDATGTCKPKCTACCEDLKSRHDEEETVSPASGLAVSVAISLCALLAKLTIH
jgi:uncharacterized protein (DUF983 family)